MESKVEKLKASRIKIHIEAEAADFTSQADEAFRDVTSRVAVRGFRPGKAPRPLLVQSAGKAQILSAIVDAALPDLLQSVVTKQDISLIEPPHYTLEKLCEITDDGNLKAGTSLVFTAEADYAPEVVVGDYHKLSISPTKAKSVTDKDVTDILDQLADRRAHFKPVSRAAKTGDRVEIDFAGKRNGLPEERLASTHYPAVIGSKVMIPGFEDALVGHKAGETFSIELTFPKDYHAKDLAGEKVVFDIVVHRVEEKQLPARDDAFAEQFGHKTMAELTEAIRQQRSKELADQAKEANEAAVLEAFLKLVKTDVPASLVERELGRQMEALHHQVAHTGMTFDHYLNHLKKDEAALREEMRPHAEKAVKIGLGLGEVVTRESLDKDDNPGYAAIQKLVAIATKAA